MLRGTESDCRYGPSSSRPIPSTPAAGASSSSVVHHNTKRVSRAVEELNRVKASVAALEAEVYRLETAEEVVVPVSPEERANWERVLQELPSRATCEILLEYLVQEVSHSMGMMLM